LFKVLTAFHCFSLLFTAFHCALTFQKINEVNLIDALWAQRKIYSHFGGRGVTDKEENRTPISDIGGAGADV
jgi:hypothetical protein